MTIVLVPRVLCLVLSLVLALAASSDAAPRVRPELLSDGYYYPEDAPTAFGRLEYVELWTSLPGPAPDFAPVPKHLFGGVVVARHRYKSESVSLDGKVLTFKTVASKNVRYTFSGTFVQSGKFIETPPDGVVLEGTLEKIVGGKTTAKARLRFTYFAGD